MGLCKCPRKKVTNLFCFEHRVNVCEHCLLSQHSQCVVQSYLEWLQDSDYDPNCALCQSPMSDQKRETVRLACLRSFFVLPELEQSRDSPNQPQQQYQHNAQMLHNGDASMPAYEQQQLASRKIGGNSHESVTHNHDHNQQSSIPVDLDTTEHKYKRRSALNWLQTLLRSRQSGKSRTQSDPLIPHKRLCFVFILVVVGVVTLITLMTSAAAGSEEYDPFLDPLANPNIRIQDSGAGGPDKDAFGH